MPVYLLAYDLVNEKRQTFDYNPLWNELKRLGARRTQYSLWLLSLKNPPKEVGEYFSRFVDKDDRLWITRIHPKDYWFTNAIGGTNAWLGENGPD